MNPGEKETMKILITGHEGFVGRHLLPKLQALGHEVVGTEAAEEFMSVYVAGEFDAVVHLAANIVNVDERSKMGVDACADIILDLKVCSWVQANPPKHVFLVMSSCAVDYPQDPYCVVKRTLELFARILHAHKVPVVVLRPFSGYGEDQSTEYPYGALTARVKRREDPLFVWGGDQVRDWIHIDDLTDAIIMAIDKFPRTWEPVEIGTGVGSSLFELARYIATREGYHPVIQSDATKATSSGSRIADTTQAGRYGFKAKTLAERR